MKVALVYQKQKNKTVRCLVCQRKCLIADGETGFCLTKLNQKGVLYSLNYGLITGIQVDPIEKKPFYHFHPGALVPSIGSYGCNFRCQQCLNWQHSWGEPASSMLKSLVLKKEDYFTSPKKIIEKIKKSGYKGIAFTYNEPVVWAEYVLETAKLAKKENLFTLFVTNGSWSKETLDIIGPFIDAANVDFKGFSQKTYTRQGAFFGQVPEITKYGQQKYQIFMEITTLLIPGINDDPKELKEMTQWIVKNLGSKTPWHLSQYDPKLAPDKAFRKIPCSSIEQLEKAAGIGRKSGLEFVYIWAPDSLYSRSDLVCPKCRTVCIRRAGWEPEILAVDKKGRCAKCGEDLNLKLA